MSEYYREQSLYEDTIKQLRGNTLSDKIIVSGIVESKDQRLTKSGITWSLKIDNVNYGFFTNEPKASQGDNVSFYAKANGNFWNADAKSLKLNAAGTPAPQKAPASAPAAATKTSAWVPDKDRQDSIIFQSARKDALEFLNLQQAVGILDLGKSAKAAGKTDVLEIYLDKYTQRFFEDTKNLGHKEQEAAVDKTFEGMDDLGTDDIPY